MNKTMRLIIVFLLLIMAALTISCDNSNENSPVDKEITTEEQIYQRLSEIISTLEKMTRAQITYVSFVDKLNPYFEEIPFLQFNNIVKKSVMWQEAPDGPRIFGDEVTDENINLIREDLTERTDNEEGWIFTNYEVSNYIYEENQVKMVVRLEIKHLADPVFSEYLYLLFRFIGEDDELMVDLFSVLHSFEFDDRFDIYNFENPKKLDIDN